jgi:CDP-glucose 4,6-dehydratase
LNCFKGKVVLVTGHTGFKGSWLSIWLTHLGAKVIGVSSDIPTNPSNFKVAGIEKIIDDYRIDITNLTAINKLIKQIQPDFVFHLAAQSLVRMSYEKPIETITTNAIGSSIILDSLRVLNKKVIAIMITSDKVYDNVEWVWGYKETDIIGGKDPYSASKGMAELAIRTFVESFFNASDSNISVGIARAGNVIGGGDWAKDRIVPDCMNSWSKNKPVEIRKPDATRPWQHVLEPLSGYLLLARDLFQNGKNHGKAYNFGPSSSQNYSVRQLIDEMSLNWDKVQWNDVSMNNDYLHEAGLLKLNCDKARFELDWEPVLEFSENVKMTVEWYKYYYQNQNLSMYDFNLSQIKKYTDNARLRNFNWINYE